MTLTSTRGLLPAGELESMGGLWAECLPLIRDVALPDWAPILRAVRAWAYPDPQLTAEGRVAPDVERSMRAVAVGMVADLASLAGGRAGPLHAVSQLSDDLALSLDLPLDPGFEAIYPKRKREGGVWRSDPEQDEAAVAGLAEAWAQQDPGAVLRRIADIEREAAAIGNPLPNLTYRLYPELARRVRDPAAWARAVLGAGAAGHLAEPFLRRAADGYQPSWAELAMEGMDRPDWRATFVYVVLTTPSPPGPLLDAALARLEGLTGVVWAACLRGQVAAPALLELLRHRDDALAGAAAAGVWQAIRERVEVAPLRDTWRQAIRRCPETQSGLDLVLGAEQALALDWLDLHRDVLDRPGLASDALLGVIDSLDAAGRAAVLRRLPAGCCDVRLVARLVGGDPGLYRGLLGERRLSRVHLAPLMGFAAAGRGEAVPELGGPWAGMARLALDAGYAPEDLAIAALGWPISWRGHMSAMWESLAAQLEALSRCPEPRICQVGQFGRERALARRAQCLQDERHEAVFGIHGA